MDSGVTGMNGQFVQNLVVTMQLKPERGSAIILNQITEAKTVLGRVHSQLYVYYRFVLRYHQPQPQTQIQVGYLFQVSN